MVRYAIVRYTKEIVAYADEEQNAKLLADIYSRHDYDDVPDLVWYEIEPDSVY